MLALGVGARGPLGSGPTAGVVALGSGAAAGAAMGTGAAEGAALYTGTGAAKEASLYMGTGAEEGATGAAKRRTPNTTGGCEPLPLLPQEGRAAAAAAAGAAAGGASPCR